MARPIALFCLAMIASSCAGVLAGAPERRIVSLATTPEIETLKSIMPRYRLSGALTPVFYDIKLSLESAFDEITGQVNIEMTCHQPTTFVELHAHASFVTVTNARLQDRTTNATTHLGVPEVVKAIHIISFPLEQPLVPGRVYHLALWYTTRYSEGFKGFIRVYDSLHGIWLTSFLETNHARELLPCFDEPRFRASFKLELWLLSDLAEKGYVALSNTKGRKKVWNDALTIWTFEATPPIPSYLFTIAVGRFRSVCQYREEISREICVWRFSAWRDWEHTAINVIGAMAAYQRTMLNYLDVDPGARLHLIVTPSKLNGMENFGLLFVKEALWPTPDDGASYRKFLKTLFHEMAHQWFGNLVTMDWWNDIWLSESLTSFMSTQRPIVFDCNFDLTADPLVSDMWQDAIPHISYTKGAALLEMLDSIIGEARMQQLLRAYVHRFPYQSATTADFLDILSNVTADLPLDASIDVADFFEGWLTQGSHPIVFVDFDATLNTFVFSQTSKMGIRDSKWMIPIWMDCVIGTKEEKLFWVPKDRQLVVVLDDLTTTGNRNAVAFNRNRPYYYQLSFRFR